MPHLTKSSLASVIAITALISAALTNLDRIAEFFSPSSEINIESATAALDEDMSVAGELNGDHPMVNNGSHEYTIHVRSVVRKRTMLPIYNCEPVLGEAEENEDLRQIDPKPEYFAVGPREISNHYEFHITSKEPARELGFRMECDGVTSNTVTFKFKA